MNDAALLSDIVYTLIYGIKSASTAWREKQDAERAQQRIDAPVGRRGAN